MGGECNIKCGIFKKGFESNDYGYKETGNRKNGYTHKTLKTTMGDVEINAQRDRDGSFDPQCYNLKILIRPSACDNLLLYVSGYTAVTLDLFLSSF